MRIAAAAIVACWVLAANLCWAALSETGLVDLVPTSSADELDSVLPSGQPMWNVPWQPRWSARVGAVVLQRGNLTSTPYVISPVTGENLVDPAEFNFPFRAGMDVGIVRYGQAIDFDFRYFGVDRWSATQGPFLSPDGFALPITGFNNNANFPLNIFAQYLSSLHSAEFNLRHNVGPRLGLLAGFRYVSLREHSSFTVGDNNFNNGTEIFLGTNNNLFGLQIGADGVLWNPVERFRIEGALKTGVYGNGAKFALGANSIGGGGGGNVINWWGHDHTAFVGDISTTAVYQISPRWSVRIGYQLLWLAGVAIPPEQLHGIDLNNGTIGTNTSHSAFFHGALASLERCW